MIKNQQYYILKFSTSFLKKKKYKFDITLDTAIKSNQVVQMGDSAVLREIRRITNHSVNLSEVNKLISQRNKLKDNQNSRENASMICKITKKINDALFIPEYISIVVDNISHYEFINNNSLVINGKKFKRLMCSTSGARHNTVFFVDEDIYEEVDKFITNYAKNIEISPAKYNAYYALCSSASIPVSWINFCVIPDYNITKNVEVEYVSESENEGHDDSVDKKNMDCKFNIWDGMGIISPDGAKKWADDLELDYLPSAFCISQFFIYGSFINLSDNNIALD